MAQEKFNPEHKSPCLDKNCSWCCNPVKVPRFLPPDKLPKDKGGQPLWTKRKELLVPEDSQTKLETYYCKNYDSATGKCTDYENRPDICKNTECVDPNSTELIDRQHQKVTSKKFSKITP
ncbi:MAG: hypothetical protein A2750_00220 [Candidatus Yanofskybacteria bacterium RIFCSPHIGHO2_01_FULL_45_42]|uniref:Uncharacterized protein n=3 Tax=Candidatus Yanofskyibacteriota TaxID=1752733 RepID=A0A1F8F410_9BACT|nr:MAG: hypothetical protein A2750_00220 [Candidatus Yanofskybacteria bacterium RIFCSPHIGHO2_01_FULL_45_42]OGN15850.1 MAG: hypothetical protein A3C81_02025 [Candidatus Yanofskybacteria bacterium RIFCSPHIGHO2_02_FULL_46_19]OGN27427.1 MAG: hypothetical protein A3B17_01480 [Candidatus Yanofskybacteria bacterium RIFCSPLOWO2_01_FULL_45_72]OGN32288.1 MAG: hypothetical protein A3J01_02390 [Candidatus Yanofskybacteria bacterium RIFCSPLOWO2_02_FULL_45_18]